MKATTKLSKWQRMTQTEKHARNLKRRGNRTSESRKRTDKRDLHHRSCKETPARKSRLVKQVRALECVLDAAEEIENRNSGLHSLIQHAEFDKELNAFALAVLQRSVLCNTASSITRPY